jgi:formylglycine-generating enzyme required for sulfatase activity
MIKNHRLPALFCGIIIIILAGCPAEPELSSEKEITAYSFPELVNPALDSTVTGTITDTDIDLTVPYGTEVTGLTADFTTAGVSVTVGGTAQESGVTANDFSTPVTYTVTAEDGSSRDYTVTVALTAPGTKKEITAYSFPEPVNPALTASVTGTITDTDINLTVPYGTDVTGLTADFTAAGVSVTVDGTAQESGVTANDFSTPVTYTVTAEDGSSRDYTVTVALTAPGTEKEITAYSFPEPVNPALTASVTGTITDTDIDLTVPHGTDVTGLTAEFTAAGVSVTVGGTAQESGVTANDFSTPVTYTVTAEDGSSRDYTVTAAFGPAAASEGFGFSSASAVKDTGVFTFTERNVTFTMIYTQDQAALCFPIDKNDSSSSILTTKFWLGETEVTNAVTAAVLQWAYDNDRFSAAVEEPNGLDGSTVKYNGRKLLALNSTGCRVDYDGNGTFTAAADYENHPVTDISWYGAVMICNWLTEMRDGNTGNVVYTWLDNGDGDGTAEDGIWQADETDADTAKSGYRLPLRYEWEYTARYLGTSEPAEGSLALERISGTEDPDLTDGYYWTPGDYASGASADYNDAAACQTVAVYADQDPVPSEASAVKSRNPNLLGLYDMSGNVCEWTFTTYASGRINLGGGWNGSSGGLQVGMWDMDMNYSSRSTLGFRLCRTAD